MAKRDSRGGCMFISFAFAIVFAVLIWATISLGSTLMVKSVTADEYLLARTGNKPFETERFDIKEPCIVEIEYQAPLNNSWIWLGNELVDEEGRPVQWYTVDLSYYHGYEGGESWSEGSRVRSKLFKVTKPGKYLLRLGGEGGAGNAGKVPRGEAVTVLVKSGIVLQRWFVVGLSVCLIIGILCITIS